MKNRFEQFLKRTKREKEEMNIKAEPIKCCKTTMLAASILSSIYGKKHRPLNRRDQKLLRYRDNILKLRKRRRERMKSINARRLATLLNQIDWQKIEAEHLGEKTAEKPSKLLNNNDYLDFSDL